MKRLLCLVLVCGLPFYAQATPLNEKKVLDFFKQYTTDYKNPSAELVKYYTEKSRLHMTVSYPWGAQKITLNGNDFKEILEYSLKVVKKSNQVGTYSDIKIDLQNSVAILTADRTVANLCFTDKDYKIVLVQDLQGTITVREENVTSDPVAINTCIDEHKRQVRLAKRKGIQLDDMGIFATSLY